MGSIGYHNDEGRNRIRKCIFTELIYLYILITL